MPIFPIFELSNFVILFKVKASFKKARGKMAAGGRNPQKSAMARARNQAKAAAADAGGGGGAGIAKRGFK